MQEPKAVGAGPLIRAVCESIGLREVIDENVEWDPRHCKLSPGERIQALIINILTRRRPLYRVWETFEESDVELLLGSGVAFEDVNDDALARALDKLQAADARLIFSFLTARVMACEQIEHRFLHWDSTTRSLYGEYPTATGNGAIKPTYGHSKDKRPDLKQIVMTLLCNREGIPLCGEVKDGNASDKRANREMVDALCEWFSPEAMRELVYVADSALVTGPNLNALEQAKLRFLSRLPETFGAAAKVKALAWGGSWEPIGQVSSRRDAAEYWASEQSGVIEGRTYRLVVYRSDRLNERKAKTMKRRLDAERKELAKEAESLNRRRFACAADAQAGLDAWRDEHPDAWHTLGGTVAEQKQRQKRDHRGRPPKGEEPRWDTYHQIQPTVGEPDPARIQAELQRRSAFVLITDLPAEEFPAPQLLREYKLQTGLEQRFHFIKDPIFVDAFFVHNPPRVEALAYVLLMACLVFSVLERRIRRAGQPLPTPTRGELSNPTGFEILHHVRSALVVSVDRRHRELFIQASFRKAFRAILKMAGFDESIYTLVPLRDTG